MTEIQNPKQKNRFKPVWNLMLEIWNLFGIWYLEFGIWDFKKSVNGYKYVIVFMNICTKEISACFRKTFRSCGMKS